MTTTALPTALPTTMHRPALPARLAYATLAYLGTVFLAVVADAPRADYSRRNVHYVPWMT